MILDPYRRGISLSLEDLQERLRGPWQKYRARSSRHTVSANKENTRPHAQLKAIYLEKATTNMRCR
jgi:hypothetical protein